MHTDSLSLVEIKTKRRLMRNYTNTPSVWSSTYVNIIINTEIKNQMVINKWHPQFITFSLFYEKYLIAIKKFPLAKLKFSFISTLKGEGKIK